MPNLGMSRLRSDTAVTVSLSPLKNDGLKSLPRLRMEIAMSGPMAGVPSSTDLRRPKHDHQERVEGLRASYRRLSHNVASQGQRKMSIYGCALDASARVETRGDSQSRRLSKVRASTGCPGRP